VTAMRLIQISLIFVLSGCAGWRHAPESGIKTTLQPPELPSPVIPANLPEAPTAAVVKLGDPTKPDAVKPLELDDVLESVQSNFPLLLAIEQERAIAAGNQLAAMGAFDLNLKSRGSAQEGTFENQRMDFLAEQPTLFHGVSLFSGYRAGYGDYPVYYGDRKTADGGEFRAGIQVPLLKDGAIDRRRATLRQARIAQQMAEPTIQRARIDYLRNAAKTYWSWAAAGRQYAIASSLMKLARDRQAGFDEQFRRGQIAEFVVIDNRRLVAEREGVLIGAERRLQQTALELSLFLRDAEANPQLPSSDRLPTLRPELVAAPKAKEQLASDIEIALQQRPELTRFRLLKERIAVDQQLAENQLNPTLNAVLAGAQDVGLGKKSPGIFALDRSNYEASLVMEVPLQRRDATGKMQVARAGMAQTLAQERFARDQIVAEVQDATSNLDRAFARLQMARQEAQIAQRVAELEFARFEKGQGTLLEVNLRELAAAGAQSKVIDTLADVQRAQADLRAATGTDARLDDAKR
jgi:cobalt-zinc-cadmium efflux system outer membrane protein